MSSGGALAGRGHVAIAQVVLKGLHLPLSYIGFLTVIVLR